MRGCPGETHACRPPWIPARLGNSLTGTRGDRRAPAPIGTRPRPPARARARYFTTTFTVTGLVFAAFQLEVAFTCARSFIV